MISLFLLYASEDAAWTETLRTGLEIQGYRLWRAPQSVQVSDVLHPYTPENALLGSSVVLIVWSSHAARSTEVAHYIPFALDLKKTILPLLLDQTDLTAALQHFVSFAVQDPSSDIGAQLVQQRLLPPLDSADPLITLTQFAASHLLAERKAAVQQAAALLQRNEQRPEVLALLIYLARHDLMTGVREAAQMVLDADANRHQVPSSPSLLTSLSANAGDIIGFRCLTCGNVTYFNKQRICNDSRPVLRSVGRDDELSLECGTCGAMMTVHVNCEG